MFKAKAIKKLATAREIMLNVQTLNTAPIRSNIYVISTYIFAILVKRTLAWCSRSNEHLCAGTQGWKPGLLTARSNQIAVWSGSFNSVSQNDFINWISLWLMLLFFHFHNYLARILTIRQKSVQRKFGWSALCKLNFHNRSNSTLSVLNTGFSAWTDIHITTA